MHPACQILTHISTQIINLHLVWTQLFSSVYFFVYSFLDKTLKRFFLFFCTNAFHSGKRKSQFLVKKFFKSFGVWKKSIFFTIFLLRHFERFLRLWIKFVHFAFWYMDFFWHFDVFDVFKVFDILMFSMFLKFLTFWCFRCF
jgi:hypothetical protein